MPKTDYIKIVIGDHEVIVNNPDEIPVSIDYALEDKNDFQAKESGKSFQIETPATTNNSAAANTFHNPSVADLTEGGLMRDFNPAIIEANGYELLKGKGIMVKGKHKDRPTSYIWNLYGDNADWMIDLKEATLYDLLKHIQFVFSKENIMSSWEFDGSNEQLPYVFAPVRYREPFGGYIIENSERKGIDGNVKPEYLRPALSKYWILYWGFKLAGYTLDSNFVNTDFYRRMTMPWTWGNFLSSEGTKMDIHKFLAKSIDYAYYDSPNGGHDAIWDLNVTNDSTDGGFDNNGVPGNYTYNPATYEMTWTYNPPHFGMLEATFSMMIEYQFYCSGNSSGNLYVQWFKNGVRIPGLNGIDHPKGNFIDGHDSSGLGGVHAGMQEMFVSTVINPGDVITAKIHRHTFESSIGSSTVRAKILQFKLDYFKIPLGGLIDFENYTGLKKWKFLDFLKGECDMWNLSFNTDTHRKKVVIEPTHSYKIGDTTYPGYFNGDFIDWTEKCDLRTEWELESVTDGAREQLFQFKEDGNDGLLKKVNDRHMINLGASKYVLPNRFKAGSDKIENRFYSATMHYEADQFKTMGICENEGVSPQFICIVPENISNTSNEESANTFNPKSAYYKGIVIGAGAWVFDNEVRQDLPFMFAVNYHPGGEDDPVLSYTDERIGVEGNYTIGEGLLRKFYLQRMAIQRNGQRYNNSTFNLNNNDVAGRMHREYKVINGNKWELIQIVGYRPLKSESTRCVIRKWVPVTMEDAKSIYPSRMSIAEDNPVLESLDMKYAQLKCLQSDIPK